MVDYIINMIAAVIFIAMMTVGLTFLSGFIFGLMFL